MISSSSPGRQSSSPSRADAPDDVASFAPATSQAITNSTRAGSSSPNRNPYPARASWLSRMPIGVEQMFFLTLGVIMFATALIALQMVLVVTLLITRLL